jgi:hypothetical protein
MSCPSRSAAGILSAPEKRRCLSGAHRGDGVSARSHVLSFVDHHRSVARPPFSFVLAVFSIVERQQRGLNRLFVVIVVLELK